MPPKNTANLVNCLSYAKVNLTLDVGLPQPDGYHPIRSIMHTLTLHDVITLERSEGKGIVCTLSGPQASNIPTDESNLAVEALRVVAKEFSLDLTRIGLSIHLHKKIPSQAGLGGGSSNAATSLIAIDSLFNLKAKPSVLIEMAHSIGSDVPFFLTGGSALVQGTGEKISPVPSPFNGYSVLIAQGVGGVLTRSAYQALDAIPGRVPGASTECYLDRSRLGQLPDLHNDFQHYIAESNPTVAQTLKLVEELSGSSPFGGPVLCGSGSAVFKVFNRDEDLSRMADCLRLNGLKAWVTSLTDRKVDCCAG